MNITISINQYTTPNELIAISRALQAMADTDFSRATHSQPAVEQNTGTLDSGHEEVSSEANPPLEVQGVDEGQRAAPTPVKRGRKPKVSDEPAAPVAEESTPIEDPAAIPLNSQCRAGGSTEAAGSSITVDDVRARLQEYAAAHGVEAGLQLLKQFDANRISELAPENFAAFAEACAV